MHPCYLQCGWLLDVKPYASSSTFLLFGSFVWVRLLSILRRVLSVLLGRLPWYLCLWWDVCCRAWFPDGFLFIYEKLFLFFLSSLLVWWCLLSIFPSICNLAFIQAFRFFLDLAVLFFPLFVFSTFHYEHGTFFYAKFHYYILLVYSYCLYQSFQFFFIFCKQLDVLPVHEVIDLVILEIFSS